MRRPLKPFVTEYKPSTRRQIPATRHAQSFAVEAASPTPFEGGRHDPTSRGDDSYGAALRAADALFSPPKDKPSPSVGPNAGEVAGDAGAGRAAGRGSGRILRVIDEPVPEPTGRATDEPDGEPTPKRRGRKPGSKNRPKGDASRLATAAVPDAGGRRSPSAVRTPGMGTSAADADATTGSAIGDGPAGRDHAAGGEHVAGGYEAGAGADGGLDAATREVAGPADTAEPVAALPSRERRRFPWVRTKLKPGQEWKRRLPKVCW